MITSIKWYPNLIQTQKNKDDLTSVCYINADYFWVVGVNCSLMGNVKCLCTINPTHKITKYVWPCFLVGNNYLIETTCNLSANIRSLIAGTQLSQVIHNYPQFSPIVPLCTVFGTPLQLKLCFWPFRDAQGCHTSKSGFTHLESLWGVCACVSACMCVCMHGKRVLWSILHLGSVGCQQIGQTVLSKLMTIIAITVMALHLCVCAPTMKVCHHQPTIGGCSHRHTVHIYVWNV